MCTVQHFTTPYNKTATYNTQRKESTFNSISSQIFYINVHATNSRKAIASLLMRSHPKPKSRRSVRKSKFRRVSTTKLAGISLILLVSFPKVSNSMRYDMLHNAVNIICKVEAGLA